VQGWQGLWSLPALLLTSCARGLSAARWRPLRPPTTLATPPPVGAGGHPPRQRGRDPEGVLPQAARTQRRRGACTCAALRRPRSSLCAALDAELAQALSPAPGPQHGNAAASHRGGDSGSGPGAVYWRGGRGRIWPGLACRIGGEAVFSNALPSPTPSQDFMQMLSPAYMLPDAAFTVLDKCPQLATRTSTEVRALAARAAALMTEYVAHTAHGRHFQTTGAFPASCKIALSHTPFKPCMLLVGWCLKCSHALSLVPTPFASKRQQTTPGQATRSAVAAPVQQAPAGHRSDLLPHPSHHE
jgi:hypothetical protein